MANFPPFKAYIVLLLDEMARRYRLTEPFLDVGCGSGDVAAALARRGWRGKAIDASARAAQTAQTALAQFPSVQVSHERLAEQSGGCYGTVVMLDVLEHIQDDRAALEQTAALQRRGSGLLLTVPSNPDRERAAPGGERLGADSGQSLPERLAPGLLYFGAVAQVAVAARVWSAAPFPPPARTG